MTAVNAYATLAELRAKLSLSASTAANAENTAFENILEASSRWIDRYCGRRFYGVAETRYYTAQETGELQIDDLTSVTTLKTDDNGDGTFETTVPSTAYNLKYGDNYNAALDGKPYTQIEMAESGAYTFPVAIRKGVLVRGVFGYVASTNSTSGCPDPIHDATLLLAERIFKRKDAPLGVAGNFALGQQPVRVPNITADPDISNLLDPYKRYV